MPVANTLTYNNTEKIYAVKSFIVRPLGSLIQNFLGW